MKILFMCVANSARSQLAEGLAKSIFDHNVEIQSAGSVPTSINPMAIEVLNEVGIDISLNFSKNTAGLSPSFLASLDYVITLCAEEVCPVLISKAKKMHWPLPDPAGHPELSVDERRQLFRNTRDAIQKKLLTFKNDLKI